MRTFVFVLVLSLAAALAITSQAVLGKSNSQGPRPAAASGGQAMWTRAHIRVLPLDVMATQQAELRSLHAWVEEAEAHVAKLRTSDPAVRAQLARQSQLMRSLLSLAERQASDAGKSAAAVEVQRRLNDIEGRTMCEACHAGTIAEPRAPARHGS